MTEPGVGTNRYAYSFNDPVNLSDPTGNLTTGDADLDYIYYVNDMLDYGWSDYDNGFSSGGVWVADVSGGSGGSAWSSSSFSGGEYQLAGSIGLPGNTVTTDVLDFSSDPDNGVWPEFGPTRWDYQRRYGLAAPAPIWAGTRSYRGEGVKTPYRHIMDGHRFIRSEVGKTGASMFFRGTKLSHLQAWARLISRDGTARQMSNGKGWIVEGRIGRSAASSPVGFTVTGKPTNQLRLMLDNSGQVITMFPM